MLPVKFSLGIFLLAGWTALQAQTVPPMIQEGVTTPIEPKLTYRPPGQPLKIDELAKAQRKKLEDDFYKRAGFTNVQPPVVIKPVKTITKVEKPLTRYSISIVGIYGPTGQLKGEVYYQGKLQTLSTGSLGFFTIEKVMSNSVEVSYSKTASNGKNKKSLGTQVVRQILKPGESLEVAI